jgi:hypothetical protein
MEESTETYGGMSLEVLNEITAPYVIRTLPTLHLWDMTPRYWLITWWCSVIPEANGILNPAFLNFSQTTASS